MSDFATPGFGTFEATRQRRGPQYAVRRETLIAVVLYGMAYLCLFRATGMWFGYPSTQNENSLVEPATQQIMLYSLIPFVATYCVLDPMRVTRAILRIPVAAWILALLILTSVIMSRDVMASARGLAAVIIISIPLLLFKERYGSLATYRVLRNFAAFAVLVNLAYTAVLPGYGIMGGSLAGSVRGMFMHKNLFGQFCAIAFVLLLPSVSALRPLRWSTLFFAFCALLALASAVLSRSSTALVLLALGTGTVVTISAMRRVPIAALRGYLYVLSITILAFATFTVGYFVVESIAGIIGRDLTLSGRTELWEALIPAIFERPLFGHGFAFFRTTEYLQDYTANIAWGPRSTHNSYIEFALNTGIIAASVWVVFLLGALGRKAVRLPKDPSLFSIRAREVAVMLMVTVGAFTEAGLLFAPLITWVILLAAFGSPEERHIKRRPVRLTR